MYLGFLNAFSVSFFIFLNDKDSFLDENSIFFFSDVDLVLSRVETLTDRFGERSSFFCLGSLKNSHYFDNLRLSFMKGLMVMFGFSLKV